MNAEAPENRVSQLATRPARSFAWMDLVVSDFG